MRDTGFLLDSWTLKMGPLGCPETSVANWHYWLRNEPRGTHISDQNNFSVFIYCSFALYNPLLSLVMKNIPLCGDCEANACSRKSPRTHRHTKTQFLLKLKRACCSILYPYLFFLWIVSMETAWSTNPIPFHVCSRAVTAVTLCWRLNESWGTKNALQIRIFNRR